MSGSLLVENFDQLVLAPNGARKLRELVLLLAFQGRLVEPDAPEAHAHDLMQEISIEKERLVAQRLLRPETQLPDITPEEIPYPLPNNWRWTRLGNIVNYGGAEKVESKEISDEDWVLDLEDIEKDTSRIVRRLKFKDRPSTSSKARFMPGDVLYGKLRPYLNKVIVADSEGYCTTEIIPIHIYTGIDSEYLKFSLMRPDHLKYVIAKSYGMKMPRLGTHDARMALIPLAPTGEQLCIAKKIREMMAHLDDLESHQKKQNEARLALNSSALTHLVEAKESKAFAIHWKRIHDNFDLLYDTSETVSELRKAILQLAVQGKLVPQDPNDEPASTLLEKIKDEKDRLISEKKIRKSEPLPPIKPEEIPYELPSGWEWVRLGEVSRIFTGSRDANEGSPNGKYPFFTCASEPSRSDTYLVDGESLILPGNGANVGLVLFYAGRFEAYQRTYVVTDIRTNARYAYYYFRAYWKQRLEGKHYGSATNYIKIGNVTNFILGIPPIDEQRRIVDRLDGLMSLCNDMENKLNETNSASEQLMDAVVREVVGQ